MASIEELLDEMEDILAEAKGKAFSNRATVDVEALKEVLADIRTNFPQEIMQAQLLASERREILDRAKRDASAAVEDSKIISRDLMEAAEKRSKDMDAQTNRRTEELIRAAQQKSQELIAAAQREAERIASSENIVIVAQTEADRIKAEADSYYESAKIDAQRMLQEAEEKSTEKVKAAEKWSRDLKVSAGAYVNDIVTDAEYRIGKSYDEIRTLQQSLIKASKKSNAKRKPQQSNDAFAPAKKKPAQAIKTEPEFIVHQSVIDIPLDDDFNSALNDDPPLHEKSNYNIEL